MLRWSGQRLLAALWERGDVRDYDLQIPDPNFPLSEEQIDICNALTDVVAIRDEAVEYGNEDVQGDCMWIQGRAGTGKSQIAAAFVHKIALQNRRIVICTPTGVLEETYRSMYEDTENVEVGAFDSIFGYWSDRQDLVYLDFTFDVVVVDEVGFLDKEII